MTMEQQWRNLAARVSGEARAVYMTEADRCADVARRHAGKPGHAWLVDPWRRLCVHCGLSVSSLSFSGAFNIVEVEAIRSYILFDGEDMELPPCLDGAAGDIATARSAAPWVHT